MSLRKRLHVGLGLLLAVLAAAFLPGGCVPNSDSTADPNDSIIPSDFDGIWRITSETGLANFCVTITGDRVTQIGECDAIATFITETEPSVRSEDRIIWTFESVESTAGDVVTVTHTISVTVQSDDTLFGTYSIRTPGEPFPLIDRIIMIPYVPRF